MRGYTLIELLVSITIIALLAVVVAPELSNLNKSQSVQDSAELIVQKLLEARGMAQAPPQDNNKADSYGLKFSESNGQINQIQLQVHRASGVTALKRVVKLDNSRITATNPVDTTIVWYAVGSQNKVSYTLKNDTAQKSPQKDITITLNNLSADEPDPRQITINKDSGVINVTEP